MIGKKVVLIKQLDTENIRYNPGDNGRIVGTFWHEFGKKLTYNILFNDIVVPLVSDDYFIPIEEAQLVGKIGQMVQMAIPVKSHKCNLQVGNEVYIIGFNEDGWIQIGDLDYNYLVAVPANYLKDLL